MALYAFDGTWQRNEIDDEKDTNVCRFLAAYNEPGVQNLYTAGVGTKLGFVGKAFGGAFGIGGWHRIIQAKKHLEANWKSEPLVIIGFSRGSALAVDFANEVSKGINTSVGTKVPEILFLGLWDLGRLFWSSGKSDQPGLSVGRPCERETVLSRTLA